MHHRMKPAATSGLHLKHIIPFIPLLKVTTFMALIMTRVDYLFTRYTVVVVPYVVFSDSSGSHVSWLPGVCSLSCL